MSEEFIPFGKYKGQPLEAIQSDKPYLDWLLAQSWFKEKHNDFYTIIINNFQEPADTPLHNSMQMKFLNPDYVLALLTEFDSELKEYKIVFTDFEVHGWDVRTRLSGECGVKLDKYRALESQKKAKLVEYEELSAEANKNEPVLDYVRDRKPGDYFRHQEAMDNHRHREKYGPKIKELADELKVLNELLDKFHFNNKDYWIEIKPTVSDDFPSVLRQIVAMSQNEKFRNFPWNNTKILLVGEYTGIGATKEEFIAFMNSKNINVIFA
jgi:hypothetical protein